MPGVSALDRREDRSGQQGCGPDRQIQMVVGAAKLTAIFGQQASLRSLILVLGIRHH